MSTRVEEYGGVAEVVGRVVYEPGWYLLEVPAAVHASLVALLGPLEALVKPSGRPHVSIMKGEAASQYQEDWGVAFVGEDVAFKVSPVVRGDNGLHVWVDCHSARLCAMREHFGLVTLRRGDGAYLVNFHLTIGRRRKAVERQLRPQLRLTPQSHIDVETGMQHL